MIRYITLEDGMADDGRRPNKVERHPKPGYVLPGNDWYSDTLAGPPQVSSGLGALLVGILLGSVMSSSMIALGAWFF